jgi:hypothetical protein
MSVGLVFWIVSELAEVVRSRAHESRHRRAEVAAIAVVDDVLGRARSTAPGLRPRPVYLLATIALIGAAVYVAIGSAANFFKPGGYVVGIAWLLALASAVSTLAVVYAVTALTVYVTYPHPPPWARGILLRSPLGSPTSATEAGARPSWRLGALLAATAGVAATVVAFVAWSPEIVDRFNTSVSDWFAEHDPLGSLTWLEPAGLVAVTIGIGLVAALLALRCRVVIVCYVVSVAAAIGLGASLRPLVAQGRPATDPLAGQLESFPSVALILIVLVAGLLPLSVAVVFHRTWLVGSLRAVLAVPALASATHAMASGELPTDVIGGVLIGLSLVLACQWVIDNRQWHEACNGCPWSPDPYEGPLRGAIPIRLTKGRALQLAARLCAAAAATGTAVLVLGIDEGIDPPMRVVLQVALIVAVTAGAIVAWRWERAGAILMAVAAIGTGLLSTLEFSAVASVALTIALAVPAVLLWLAGRSTEPDDARRRFEARDLD